MTQPPKRNKDRRMGPTARDEQLKRFLEKLFYNQKFVEDIEIFRNELEIPKGGFSDFMEYWHYVKRHKEKTQQNLVQEVIGPRTLQIAAKYKLPSHFAHWIEAFAALGYNYSDYSGTPYEDKQYMLLRSLACSLNLNDDQVDHVSLHIYHGASLNAVVDFLRDHWIFIEFMLSVKELASKVPHVRQVKKGVSKKNKQQILKLAERGEITSAGTWAGDMLEDRERPDCIKKVGSDRIQKIVTEERRKKKLRARNRKHK